MSERRCHYYDWSYLDTRSLDVFEAMRERFLRHRLHSMRSVLIAMRQFRVRSGQYVFRSSDLGRVGDIGGPAWEIAWRDRRVGNSMLLLRRRILRSLPTSVSARI